MTERKHTGRQLRVEKRTTASPQRVWEAWTDPEPRLQAAFARLAGVLGREKTS